MNVNRPLTLVTGAGGFVGGQVARLLHDRGRPLRLFLRQGSPTWHLGFKTPSAKGGKAGGAGGRAPARAEKVVGPVRPSSPTVLSTSARGGGPPSGLPPTTFEHDGIPTGDRTRQSDRAGFERVEGDLRNKESVAEAMKGVEVVYHVAALYALWARRRQDFFDINVEGTRNMCEAALKAGVRRFVYTSTTGAVGISDRPDKLCDENTPWNRGWTNDPYTLSKYEAEQVVKEYVKRGLNAVILNPTGPVGPGDVHPTPTGKMIADFIRGKIPFYIDAHFSMVDVRDAAMGHLLAEEKGKTGERYILCAENLSAKEIFTKLAALSGKKPPRMKIPTKLIQKFAGIAEWTADHITHKPPLITKPYAALLPYYFWFDNSKSKRDLGITYRPIDVALKDAIEWFKANGT